MTESVSEYMDGTALFLGVEASLTDEEKQAFLAKVYERNPQLRGAQVADIIDMMSNHDAHLDVTEWLHDMHGEEIEEFHQPRLADLCAYIVIYLYPDAFNDPNGLEGIWQLTHKYMKRWMAHRCGFAWREGQVRRICSLDIGHTFPVDHHDRRAYRPYADA